MTEPTTTTITDPSTPRPVITKLQAAYWANAASVYAVAKARERGENPETTDALADAAMMPQGFKVGAFHLAYTAATVTLIEKLSLRYSEVSERFGAGHVLFLMADPGEAFLQIRTRKAFDLDQFECLIHAFMSTLTNAEFEAANEWFKSERDRVNTGKDDVPEVPQGKAGEASKA